MCVCGSSTMYTCIYVSVVCNILCSLQQEYNLDWFDFVPFYYNFHRVWPHTYTLTYRCLG